METIKSKKRKVEVLKKHWGSWRRSETLSFVSKKSIRVKFSLVSFAAVFRDVTQRFPESWFRGALRDIPKDGWEADLFSSKRITKGYSSKHQLHSLFKVRT